MAAGNTVLQGRGVDTDARSQKATGSEVNFGWVLST